MRLFAAVPVTDPAREHIAKLLGSLRATEWPVRWARDDVPHLTLKFFGEVAPARLEVIENAVRSAAEGTAPLPLRLTELGAFPALGRARVLWVGIEAPTALELLQDRMERRCEAIGFPVEGKPFRPHITLGRVREGQRLPARGLERLRGRFEPAPFVADQLVVYESVLTRDGSRYEPRFTLDLGQ